MERELARISEGPTGKPRVVFMSNFAGWRLDRNEWVVPPDPTRDNRDAWHGHGLGPDLTRVGEVFVHDQALTAKTFRKAPVSGRFQLSFSVAQTPMYAGTLDVALTNYEGWGYGVRLVYARAGDAAGASAVTRRDAREWRLDVGSSANGIFRIEKGSVTMLATAADVLPRLRMPRAGEPYSKMPVRFERSVDGWMTLRVGGRALAAARDAAYDHFERLSLVMRTPNGRLAVDDMQLTGFFTSAEEKEWAPPPVIVPEPREMSLTADRLLLTDGVQIVVADAAKLRAYFLDELVEDVAGCYGVVLTPVIRGAEDKARPLIDVAEFAESVPDLGREGYTIDVTAAGAKVRGVTERGTFYALASLFQLFLREDGAVHLRRARVRDWPDLEWRGAELTLRRDTTYRGRVAVLKDQVKMLARLKGNVLIIGSARLPFPSCPQVYGYDCQWSWEQFIDVVRYAQAHHIDVWPKVPGLSHSGWLVARYVEKKSPEFWQWIRDNKVLGAPDHQDWHYDAFNPGSPAAVELILRLGDDVIQATRARTVFIGMDEIMPPISEMVSGRDPADVLAAYINTHHAHLARQGVRMGMWADHLLEAGKYEGSCASSGSAHYKDVTHAALDVIPKDIILGDWYYATKPGRPSYACLNAKGFDAFGMPGSVYGNIHESVYYSTVEAKKAGTKGIVSFGWETGRHFNPQTSYILPMVYAWTVPDKMEPDWSMQEVWQDLYQGAKPSRLGLALSLDISGAMNESRADDVPGDGQGWFDYGRAADFRDLAPGELTYKALRFTIVDETRNAGKSVVMVATPDAVAGVADRADEIAVNTTARSLVFLHTANQGPHSLLIGTYVVCYADGTTLDIPIVYGQNIGPWLLERGRTSGFYGLFYKHGYLSESRLAYLGATAGGERVALQAFEWVNPRPDARIGAIQMRAGGAHAEKVRIALLALSAVGLTP